jgi:hypothetical protein
MIPIAEVSAFGDGEQIDVLCCCTPRQAWMDRMSEEVIFEDVSLVVTVHDSDTALDRYHRLGVTVHAYQGVRVVETAGRACILPETVAAGITR